MTSSNPFASSVVISDKQARRLYSAIDGRKNVDEICRVLFIDLKEAYQALRILWTQHRIELYGPAGEVVDSSLFFENL
jgi:hypothetical protein